MNGNVCSLRRCRDVIIALRRLYLSRRETAHGGTDRKARPLGSAVEMASARCGSIGKNAEREKARAMVTNTSLCGVLLLSAVLALLDRDGAESPAAAAEPEEEPVSAPESTPLLRRKYLSELVGD